LQKVAPVVVMFENLLWAACSECVSAQHHRMVLWYLGLGGCSGVHGPL